MMRFEEETSHLLAQASSVLWNLSLKGDAQNKLPSKPFLQRLSLVVGKAATFNPLIDKSYGQALQVVIGMNETGLYKYKDYKFYYKIIKNLCDDILKYREQFKEGGDE